MWPLKDRIAERESQKKIAAAEKAGKPVPETEPVTPVTTDEGKGKQDKQPNQPKSPTAWG